MNISKGVLSIVFAAALVGVTGCGGTTEEPAPEPEPSSSSAPAGESPAGGSEDGSAEEVVITVENFEYIGPESVSPGATITVINKDSAPHTVTSEEEGVFDVVFEGGETVTFTAPEEPGEYPYICTYHPNMAGTLVVK
ncbi:cupredoxin domain-containing protein [Arthrobacter sp. H14]|uniref:cupredoxin domain-containing protein n=1 Tax=Arthrobacter sp. H14 TaxID=1312959 RepID=UPI00047C27BD|nr:cupredoxin domain-containing protein [Arthrobacter sp. H14]